MTSSFHPIIVEIIVRLVGGGKFTVMLSMPKSLQNISDKNLYEEVQNRR